jgi:hypothetical protein
MACHINSNTFTTGIVIAGYGSGAKIIELFFYVTYEWGQYVRVFVHG